MKGGGMAAKLRVSLAEGIFEAEGDDAFVKEMHSEFKDYVGQFFGAKPQPLVRSQPDRTASEERREEPEGDEESLEAGETSGKVRRTPVRRRRVTAPVEGGPTKKARYEPQVDPDLKLPGMVDAFNSYEFRGHHEMVLFFGHFLAHDAGLNPFTASQIFTCYRMVKVKPPKSFTQAVYDNRSKRHFFKIESLDAISMTHIGDTYCEHDLKKKVDQA
jgi:hypothetical protein